MLAAVDAVTRQSLEQQQQQSVSISLNEREANKNQIGVREVEAVLLRNALVGGAVDGGGGAALGRLGEDEREAHEWLEQKRGPGVVATVAEDLGAHEARMQRDARDARVAEATRQLDREEDVGQLAVTIGAKRRVRLFRLQVVPVDVRCD